MLSARLSPDWLRIALACKKLGVGRSCTYCTSSFTVSRTTPLAPTPRDTRAIVCYRAQKAKQPPTGFKICPSNPKFHLNPVTQQLGNVFFLTCGPVFWKQCNSTVSQTWQSNTIHGMQMCLCTRSPIVQFAN